MDNIIIRYEAGMLTSADPNVGLMFDQRYREDWGLIVIIIVRLRFGIDYIVIVIEKKISTIIVITILKALYAYSTRLSQATHMRGARPH